MLSLLNIKKYYDKNLALDIPSLQLGNNIYWAKGQNGSGKTTLLRMVAGLLPFEGNILLDNVSLKRQALSYRRSVSWADAEPLFPPFMTGIDMVTFYRNIRRAPKQEADMLFGLFGMNDFVQQKINTYSSGMTKKLSLVLAFLGNVPLIVLDEPLITLDADALHAVCTLIRERHLKNGTTFLLSSHMEPDAALLASARELIVYNNSVSLT